MVLPLDKPIVCPVLVGRSTYLERLTGLFNQAAGQGQVILLEGEAGIGKSRLLAEAVSNFLSNQSLPVLRLQGRCFEPEQARPYAPLAELLRTWPEGSEAESTLTARRLARLLDGADFPVSFSSERYPDRHDLQQTLAEFLLIQARLQPLVLVFEDIHWSDEASLEFLVYLAVRIADQPITLIFTYRGGKITGSLRSFLAALDREHKAFEFRLTPLKRDETEIMVRRIFELNTRVKPDFLQTLYQLTEGNPFFIEEVLKSLLVSGQISRSEGKDGWEFKPGIEIHIPRTVQVAVQQQTDLLGRPALELAALAAVAGRRFNFNLLQALTGYSDRDLFILLKELIRAQLLIEESADVFAFRHALTRQAVYADLLSRERREFHHKVAETIENLPGLTDPEKLAELSYHYYEAGQWSKVAEPARLAGDQALNLYAPALAILQYNRAIEAADKLGQPAASALYRNRGRAYELLGDFEKAGVDYTQAQAAARTAGDKIAHWQSLLDLGFLWTGRDYGPAARYFQQALELAREIDNPAALAHSFNRIGNWYLQIEQPLEGLKYHLEALALFQQLEDTAGIVETLDLLGTIHYHAGDLVQGAEFYRQAIRLFRDLNNRQGLVSALTMLAFRGSTYLNDILVSATPGLSTSLFDIEEALTDARQTDQRPAEAFGLIVQACVLGPKGDYCSALSAAARGLEIGRELGHIQWLVFGYWLWGALYLDILAYTQAQENLSKAMDLARQVGSKFWEQIAASFLAASYTATGQYSQAEGLLQPGADEPVQAAGYIHVTYRQACLELARANPGEALRLLAQLEEMIPYTREKVVPKLYLLRAECLLATGQPLEALELSRVAAEMARSQEAFSMVWRSLGLQARIYQALNDPAQASEVAEQARTIILKLAAEIEPLDLQENFTRLALEMLPLKPVARPAAAGPGGLSQREREVAGLIAQGKSNRIIAAELVVSERTVEKHIENIMNKLDFSSRSQIAVWVVETAGS